MELLGAIGIGGVALYLLAYALLQLGLLRGSGYSYTLLNMSAASCVLVSLLEEFNLSSFLIQISWILISIVGLFRMFLRDRNLDFTREEIQLAHQALPKLAKPDLRELLDLGKWNIHQARTILTLQDLPVEDLIYIADGQADVICNDVKVAELKAGSFIGEMTCLSGDPATATVLTSGTMRCFRIPAPLLRTFLARRPEIMDHLERAFGADLRRKLNASGTRVAGLSGTVAALY